MEASSRSDEVIESHFVRYLMFTGRVAVLAEEDIVLLLRCEKRSEISVSHILRSEENGGVGMMFVLIDDRPLTQVNTMQVWILDSGSTLPKTAH